jgi:hypothetical protein
MRSRLYQNLSYNQSFIFCIVISFWYNNCSLAHHVKTVPLGKYRGNVRATIRISSCLVLGSSLWLVLGVTDFAPSHVIRL